MKDRPQVGMVLGAWFVLMFILSLPLIAIAYVCGALWAWLRWSFLAGWAQCESFPDIAKEIPPAIAEDWRLSSERDK